MEQPEGKLLIYNPTQTAKALSEGGTGLVAVLPELTPEQEQVWQECRQFYRSHRKGKNPCAIAVGHRKAAPKAERTTTGQIVLDRINFYLAFAHLWEADFGILEGCMTLRDLLVDAQSDIRLMRRKVRAKLSKVPVVRLAGLTDVARKLTIDLIREGERMRDRKADFLAQLRAKAEAERPVSGEEQRRLEAAQAAKERVA